MLEFVKSMLSWVPAMILASAVACNDPVIGPDPEIYPESWDLPPHWSWAGDKIVYASPGLPDSIPDYLLFIIDTTGENRHPVVAGAIDGVFLPGDTQLVIMGADFKLYVLDLNTSSLQLLVDHAFSRFPDIDPDRGYLYYEDAGVANGWATSIYRMDLATGDTTHIIGGSFPVLSPDGRQLLFYRHDRVRCFDMASDSEWVVFAPVADAEMDWSPDGSEIVIGSINLKEFWGKLYKVRPDGTGARRFSTGLSPQYSRTGNRLSVLRPGADNRYHLFLIDPDGGNPKQLTF
ncbi:MAG TPA: hypothetical protein PK186_07560 [candidate division Zixibacteria bacterium]|nr:hypothetical protein [candidate division Zixibacteria bacterium]MDD4918084.1 hypothetical protein [candidate division Zixibacteria bacterium]MDM7972047.1 hypothetical protein [candidate division Zixibacteria bacterium]HPM37398.1 hypothetical protein [candidate division Zixibacteria bacterium]